MNPRLLGWQLCLASCWCGVAAILSGPRVTQERQEAGLVPAVPPQLVPVFIIAFVASLLNSLGKNIHEYTQCRVEPSLYPSRPPAASGHLRRPRPGCRG